MLCEAADVSPASEPSVAAVPEHSSSSALAARAGVVLRL
jgi:hypothetical protein